MTEHLHLEWLHPDGRVGGRIVDGPRAGRAMWVADGVPDSTLALTDAGTEVVRAGAQVDATCVHSQGRGGACGGCDLDRWPDAVRQEALAAMVARAYRLDGPPVLVPSPTRTGTRARIKLTIDGGKAGYRVPGSHTFIPIDGCESGRPEIHAAVQRLTSHVLHEGVESVELRSDGQRVAFAFRRRQGGHTPLPELGDVALDGKAVQGDPTLWLPHLGRALRASPSSFYQVHLELNQQLVAFVLDAVLQAGPERVLDLYAGIGNFSIPLLEAGVPVEAVELEGQATADLRSTAAGLPGLTVSTGKAERFDPSRCPFDVVILDPPRSGAGAVMDRVLRSRPRLAVHVACDPVAGARDVSRALKAGYRLRDVRCFELFPRTHHVETVTVLERG